MNYIEFVRAVQVVCEHGNTGGNVIYDGGADMYDIGNLIMTSLMATHGDQDVYSRTGSDADRAAAGQPPAPTPKTHLSDPRRCGVLLVQKTAGSLLTCS